MSLRASRALSLAAFIATGSWAFESAIAIPASAVASGKPLYVSVAENGADGNRRVDVGTLHAVADEIQATVLQDLTGEALQAARREYPRIKIPPGSLLTQHENIHCDAQGVIAARAEITIQSKAGGILYHRRLDAARQRRLQEASKLHSQFPFNYGRTPASLVCWAMARKSENAPVIWPPPDPPTVGDRKALLRYAGMFVTQAK